MGPIRSILGPETELAMKRSNRFGLALALVGPLLASVLNRSILFEAEIAEIAPVIAVVPRATRRELDVAQVTISTASQLEVLHRSEKPVSAVATGPGADDRAALRRASSRSGSDDRWGRRERA